MESSLWVATIAAIPASIAALAAWRGGRHSKKTDQRTRDANGEVEEKFSQIYRLIGDHHDIVELQLDNSKITADLLSDKIQKLYAFVSTHAEEEEISLKKIYDFILEFYRINQEQHTLMSEVIDVNLDDVGDLQQAIRDILEI